MKRFVTCGRSRFLSQPGFKASWIWIWSQQWCSCHPARFRAWLNILIYFYHPRPFSTDFPYKITFNSPPTFRVLIKLIYSCFANVQFQQSHTVKSAQSLFKNLNNFYCSSVLILFSSIESFKGPLKQLGPKTLLLSPVLHNNNTVV